MNVRGVLLPSVLLIFLYQFLKNLWRPIAWPKAARGMASGSSTRSRSLEDQIKKAGEETISHAGLITNEHMIQLIDNLESRINPFLTNLITDATKPFLDKVDALENKVALHEAHFKELDERIEYLEYRCETKVDDIEQYSRRSSLRLYGLTLPEGGTESSSGCLSKVKQIFEDELRLPITDYWFHSVYRIGKVTNHKDGKNQSQAIILKFRSWKQREEIYRAWKSLINGQRIGLEITTRRVKLLSHATEKIKGKPAIKFAFADLNCRLCLRMNDSVRYFNKYKDVETSCNVLN